MNSEVLMGIGLVAALGVVIGFAVSSSRAAEEKRQAEAYAAARAREEEERRHRDRLCAKYGEEIAEKILSKTVWIGETSEQLIDSLGPPLDIDQKVLKTKKKEVWKYVQLTANRYGYKITLENDIVVGWDEKM